MYASAGLWLRWPQLPPCTWWPSWSPSSSTPTGSFPRVGSTYCTQPPFFPAAQPTLALVRNTLRAINCNFLVRQKVGNNKTSKHQNEEEENKKSLSVLAQSVVCSVEVDLKVAVQTYCTDVTYLHFLGPEQLKSVSLKSVCRPCFYHNTPTPWVLGVVNHCRFFE